MVYVFLVYTFPATTMLLSRHRHHPLLFLLYNSFFPWFVWWEVFLLRPRFPVWSDLNYCTILMTGAGVNLKHFKHREWWNRNSFSLVRATSAILPQQSCALNILNVFLKILLLLGADFYPVAFLSTMRLTFFCHTNNISDYSCSSYLGSILSRCPLECWTLLLSLVCLSHVLANLILFADDTSSAISAVLVDLTSWTHARHVHSWITNILNNLMDKYSDT